MLLFYGTKLKKKKVDKYVLILCVCEREREVKKKE